MSEWDRRSWETPSADKAKDEGPDAEEQMQQLRMQAARHKRGLQRKAEREAGPNHVKIPEAGGAALDSGVRKKMEGHLGGDLSNVRVHTGGESAKAANSLGARAFTDGKDIHFNSGQFAPGSKEGDRLLAHELTHVVQGQKSGIQRSEDEGGKDGGGGGDGAAEVSKPEDASEVEADKVGDQVAEKEHGGDEKKGGDKKKDKEEKKDAKGEGKEGEEGKEGGDKQGGDEEKGGDEMAAAGGAAEEKPAEVATKRIARKVMRSPDEGKEAEAPEAEGAEAPKGEEGPEAKGGDAKGDEKDAKGEGKDAKGDEKKDDKKDAKGGEEEGKEGEGEEAKEGGDAAEAAPEEKPAEVSAKLIQRKVMRSPDEAEAPEAEGAEAPKGEEAPEGKEGGDEKAEKKGDEKDAKGDKDDKKDAKGGEEEGKEGEGEEAKEGGDAAEAAPEEKPAEVSAKLIQRKVMRSPDEAEAPEAEGAEAPKGEEAPEGKEGGDEKAEGKEGGDEKAEKKDAKGDKKDAKGGEEEGKEGEGEEAKEGGDAAGPEEKPAEISAKYEGVSRMIMRSPDAGAEEAKPPEAEGAEKQEEEAEAKGDEKDGEKKEEGAEAKGDEKGAKGGDDKGEEKEGGEKEGEEGGAEAKAEEEPAPVAAKLQRKVFLAPLPGAKPGAKDAKSGAPATAPGAEKKDAEKKPSPEELAAKLPSGSFTAVGGQENQVSIKVSGDTAKVEGTQPLPDSIGPKSLAAEIEADTAKYLKAKPEEQAALLQGIQTKFGLLKIAMGEARGETLPVVRLRATFEKDIGAKATAGSDGFAGADAAVAAMADSAVTMIAGSKGAAVAAGQTIDQKLAAMKEDPQLAKEIENLGIPIDIGFAGSVGKSFDKIAEALSTGSLTQKCVHLINFGDQFLKPQLTAKTEAVLEQVKANLSSGDFAKLEEKIKHAQDAKASGDKKEDKEAQKGLLSEQSFTDKVNSNGPMDQKTPDVPVEALDEQAIQRLLKQKGIEFRPDEKKDSLVEKAKKAGITKSGGASLADPDKGGITEQGMPYLQGIKANIVNPEHKWIIDATAAEMPLKAGISGTTHRFLGLGQLLGVGDKPGMRLAMLGHLQGIEAHSFWEICDAVGMGPPAGKYVPFAPVDDASMEAAAGETLAKDGEFSAKATGSDDKAAQVKRLLGTDK